MNSSEKELAAGEKNCHYKEELKKDITVKWIHDRVMQTAKSARKTFEIKDELKLNDHELNYFTLCYAVRIALKERDDLRDQWEKPRLMTRKFYEAFHLENTYYSQDNSFGKTLELLDMEKDEEKKLNISENYSGIDNAANLLLFAQRIANQQKAGKVRKQIISETLETIRIKFNLGQNNTNAANKTVR
jgi:hypothetical protein